VKSKKELLKREGKPTGLMGPLKPANINTTGVPEGTRKRKQLKVCANK
jgi:hypothetical protein